MEGKIPSGDLGIFIMVVNNNNSVNANSNSNSCVEDYQSLINGKKGQVFDLCRHSKFNSSSYQLTPTNKWTSLVASNPQTPPPLWRNKT
jgi:hypothetical protein